MSRRHIQISLDDLPEILRPYHSLIQRYGAGRTWTETEIERFLDESDKQARHDLAEFAKFHSSLQNEINRWIRNAGGITHSSAAGAVYWTITLAIAVEEDEFDHDS